MPKFMQNSGQDLRSPRMVHRHRSRPTALPALALLQDHKKQRISNFPSSTDRKGPGSGLDLTVRDSFPLRLLIVSVGCTSAGSLADASASRVLLSEGQALRRTPVGTPRIESDLWRTVFRSEPLGLPPPPKPRLSASHDPPYVRSARPRDPARFPAS